MNHTSISMEYSRLSATAESLGAAAPDRHQFCDKAVLLIGEDEVLRTQNGRESFICCLRMLLRMVKRLKIGLESTSHLFGEAANLIKQLSLDAAPQIISPVGIKMDEFDAILSVGVHGNCNFPFTVVNSNGWVARVCSTGSSLSSNCSQNNPIGATAAACLGVAEVFKRLIKLKPERGALQTNLTFSFFSYLQEDNPGPVIPKIIPLDILVVGAGAITNGTLGLLRALPITGSMRIVDNQEYGPENWGTCQLVGPEHFGMPKALAAEKWMSEKLKTMGYAEQIQDFIKRCGKEIPYPKLVVNGLDDIIARRSVQDLWPDQIIDGAIGATSCEVTLHPWGPNLSCLKCDFSEPGFSAEDRQIKATGLSRERIANLQEVLTEEDIATASPEKMEWLRGRKGKVKCSVVQEAVLALLSSESERRGFQPSVPFVACLSACMIVSELIRYEQQWPPVLETGFQFDVLFGPQYGQNKSHQRKLDCNCVMRRKNIEVLRNQRKIDA